MKISERILKVSPRKEFVYWAASVNHKLESKLSRVAGFAVSEDQEHLTFFLPKKLFAQMGPTLKPGVKMSLLMASVIDFESYQIKGRYIKHELCTPENIAFYKQKVLNIMEVLDGMGLNGKGVFSFLLDQPSIAVTMYCEEMYEQTPKPGTGKKLTD